MSLFTLQTSDQQQYGPVELETLRAWAREGRIEPENYIYDHTHLKWVEAAKLPQIMEFYQVTSKPAPAATPVAAAPRSDAEAGVVQAEKQVIAATETPKPAATATAAATPKIQSLSARLRIKKELSQSGATDGASPPRPPTVLERISRIFLAPFAKQKTDPSKNQSQKEK
ncbi:MAG: DUF4339 domain-containing protein [Verrucomicrobia bacterium]|nr:DUF4339 domain-containing protein [Verrucomicrobiota bacterium]